MYNVPSTNLVGPLVLDALSALSHHVLMNISNTPYGRLIHSNCWSLFLQTRNEESSVGNSGLLFVLIKDYRIVNL